jgi:hypothetical protein
MRPSTIKDAFDYFVRLHGSEKPMRTRDELHDRINDAGLLFDSRSSCDAWDEFWNELFDSGWPLEMQREG